MEADDAKFDHEEFENANQPVEQDSLVKELVGEILGKIDQVGELEAWAAKRFDGSTYIDALNEACTRVATQLLESDPPHIGQWEHLLRTVAIHSNQNRQHFGLSACEVMVQHLSKLLRKSRFRSVDAEILASALTVVLAAQERLTQDIEEAMRLLCDRFPEALAEIAEQCQDIWKLRGQMSGRGGLFVWDKRNAQWRLAQDFKPYRPSA